MLSVDQSDAVLNEFLDSVVPKNQPLASSYKTMYIEMHLDELQALADDGSTTATSVVFDYVRMSENVGPEEFQHWLARARDVGVERAMLYREDGRDRQEGTVLMNAGLIGVLLVAIVVALVIAVLRRKAKDKKKTVG